MSRKGNKSDAGVDLLLVVSPTIRCVLSCWQGWRACIGSGTADRGPGRSIPPTPGCRIRGIGHRGPSWCAGSPSQSPIAPGPEI